MKSPLVPCPECARHVRASEACCPFCRTALELDDAAAPTLPAERLGRSDTLGFQSLLRAGLVAAASGALGCESHGADVPMYGAPGAETGGTTATGGTGGSGGGGGTSGTAGSKATGGTSGAGGSSGTSGGAGKSGGGNAGTTGGGGRGGAGGEPSEAGEAGEGGEAGR
jgi:hypothetical protein